MEASKTSQCMVCYIYNERSVWSPQGPLMRTPPMSGCPGAGCIRAREHPESPALEDAPLLNYGPSYLLGWLSSFIYSAAAPSKLHLRKPAPAWCCATPNGSALLQAAGPLTCRLLSISV